MARRMYKSGPYSFRNCIRPAREARGISQSELARKIGMAQSNLSSLETHRREPSAGVLLRVAFALEVLVDDLLELEDGTPYQERLTSRCGDTRALNRPIHKVEWGENNIPLEDR
jgi:putative transcriptional regulator